jgi:glycosyltransferase involved in cell wall biosynthesis
MPVYNSEAYVAQAVENTLKQTYRNCKFLIVVDSSTDRFLRILITFYKQDSRACCKVGATIHAVRL